MSVRSFVDTNLLVYAHDRSTGVKNEVSRELIRSLWQERAGVVSTQVLQELYVNVRRKASAPLSAREAREVIEDYLRWPIVVNDAASVLRAIDLEERHSLSFWDALIVQAAQQADVTRLLSEDLGHGMRYGSVVVENPFREL
jgi:predicted nucleic acid-binding protein